MLTLLSPAEGVNLTLYKFSENLCAPSVYLGGIINPIKQLSQPKPNTP